MSALPREQWTEEAYLEFERRSEGKHEYLAGHVIAMTGASNAHNLIAGSTYYSLYGQLRNRLCNIYMSDMRVRVSATGLYTYPDIAVVCGEAQFADEHVDTLLNPTLIIEVLSPSTEQYDRGKKFQHYRQLESLQSYVLIAQDEARIEHFSRQKQDEWLLTEAAGLDSTIALPSIACALALNAVYERVSFEDGVTNE
ncbi:MAG: Uma2 family endonuclease [Chloroflexi bacterium]|nr:MAG: Uma2 family endonuclease [Chloroflexota bacterium]